MILIYQDQIVGVMRDRAAKRAALQAEVFHYADCFILQMMPVDYTYKAEILMVINRDNAVSDGKSHRFNMPDDISAVFRNHDIHIDGSRVLTFKQKIIRRSDPFRMDGIFKDFILHIRAAEINPVFRNQLAADEYLHRHFAVQLSDKLEVGVIARRNSSDITEALFPCTVDRGHADCVNRVNAALNCLAHQIVHMPDGKQIRHMHIIRAEGDMVVILHLIKRLQKLFEVVHQRRGFEICMHAAAQAVDHFFRPGGLMVAFDAGKHIGIKPRTGKLRAVSLQECAFCHTCFNDVMHAGRAFDHPDEIHDLRNSGHVFEIQQLADLLCGKTCAGMFKAGNRRHAGGCHRILPLRRFSSVFDHVFNALHTEHIADLMRVMIDRGGAPRDGHPGKVLRY